MSSSNSFPSDAVCNSVRAVSDDILQMKPAMIPSHGQHNQGLLTDAQYYLLQMQPAMSFELILVLNGLSDKTGTSDMCLTAEY